jgi:acyl-CoA thioester hydrolase
MQESDLPHDGPRSVQAVHPHRGTLQRSRCARHVNNVTYFTYFEIARIAYLQAVSGKPVSIDDIKVVVVEAVCRYRAPALLGDVLQVGVRVSHMRRSSFVYEYRISRSGDDRLIAEGRTIQTVFDHQSKRVAPIGAEFRRQVERFEQRTFDVHEPIPPWEPRDSETERTWPRRTPDR